MPWAVPLLLLFLLTPFSASLDLFVAKMTFYRGWSAQDPQEYGFYTTPFFSFLYLYGGIPASLTAFAAACCIIASKWNNSLKKYRGAFFVMCITLFLGSLVITNLVLKENWGRPRPRQLIEFGGSQSFRAFYEPLFASAPEPSKSFPSGHSTCGFYFFCLYFLGRRYKQNYVAILGLAVALGLGGVLSLARIVQGGHFISDAYIAALIMWLTSYFVDYLVFESPVLARFRKLFFSEYSLA